MALSKQQRIVFCFCLFSPMAFAKTAWLEKVQVLPTQINIYLTAQTKHRVFTLSNPSRIVIDLQQTRLVPNIKTPALYNTPIKRIRSGINHGVDLRLVLDLAPSFARRSTGLTVENRNPELLIVHWASVPTAMRSAYSGSHNKRLVSEYATTPLTNRHSIVASTMNRPTETQHRRVTVVIDPGHGGKDPGAMGLRGTQEKQVALAISRELAMMINTLPGFRAILTRRGDYYVGLRERLRVARHSNGDIFIAIHADALRNRRAHGASVYALSQRGANNEASRWLTKHEGDFTRLGDISLSDKGQTLKSVLLDLSQTATMSASLQLGDDIRQSLSHVTSLQRHRVEQAAFVVLKSPDLPSVLVETGYISNPYEEQRLASSAYQRQMARAIFNGVQKYFKQYPPPNTTSPIQYAQHAQKRYKVVRGDTLSTIARRYSITQHSLLQSNHLTSSRVMLGQVLLIP